VGGAAYLSEEINFYENHAVDLGHIEKALRMNLEGGEFVYGGSTVDQQLVKNLFLSRDKTLARKLREALIAWRMEGVVSKDRILELYLNCIEYGDDLYGIGPAAKYYFGKDARELTPEEATLLAIIKPAPWYGERFKRKGTTPTKHWWFDRMGEIMGRLVEKEFITAAEAEMARPYVLQWDEEGNYLPQDQQDDSDVLPDVELLMPDSQE
jgi:penicillin-binding protein 1A